MKSNVSELEIELLIRMVQVLHSWSGETEGTPDDTILISGDLGDITVGDIKDASDILNRLHNSL